MVHRVPPPIPPQPSLIDAKIWKACAGGSVDTPKLNSMVYYFPQGHIEHASSPPRNLSPHVFSRPFIHCRIIAVDFFADPETDEVFAKLMLQPITLTHPLLQSPVSSEGNACVEAQPVAVGVDGDKIVSFAKTLTPSDANNGGGFSVPRHCAETIFPPLNFKDDPPVQKLSINDVHGKTWEFRHVFRGTPRRHLLTTGWSKFVDGKKLIPDDTVVFMKDSSGKMFAGIRRIDNSHHFLKDGGDKMPDWLIEIVGLGNNVNAEEIKKNKRTEEEEEVVTEEFNKSGLRWLSSKAVAEAMELAVQNKPFEVVYYPRIGQSEFVVKAAVVDEAMSLYWRPGMRVKIRKESDDSMRASWHQGAVSAVCTNSDPQWQSSPWRMLQMAWDEPECFKNAKLISPWEIIPLSSKPLSIREVVLLPPPKKFRADEDGRVGNVFVPMTGFIGPPTTAQVNQSMLSYGITYPAGMQGARHDVLFTPTFPNSPSPQYIGDNTVPRFHSHTMPTEISIWGSQSEGFSPDSSVTDSSSHDCSAVNKDGSGSIRLFGLTIQKEKPGECGVVDGTGRTEDDDSRGCNGQRASPVFASYL